MADRPTITTLAAGKYSVATLNANFVALRDAFDSLVGTGGTDDDNSVMTGDLDLNGNTLRNATFDGSVAGVEWQGAWATATAYAVNDLVSSSGSVYICVVAHTSGMFSADLTAVYWELFASQGASGGGSGDLVSTNNLNDVSNATTALANLGVTIGVGSNNLARVNQAVTATTRATTTTLGTTLNHTLSDTSATITAFAGVQGVTYHCRALGAGTLTHHATNLIITQTGADITTAAGDTFDVEMLTTTTCRIKNYIKADGAALVPLVQADAAAVAAETNQDTYVPPDLIKHNPGVANAWVRFTGTGTVTIVASHNVSSVTDNGTGDYTVNFTSALSNGNYAFSITASGSGTFALPVVAGSAAPSAAAFRLNTLSSAGAAIDAGYVSCIFYDDA